ncbi:MAG TPA: TOBE domain-containing protein [Bacilli bacterium]|nr:TOBE domain-containing protein [Bacilli bacterium]
MNFLDAKIEGNHIVFGRFEKKEKEEVKEEVVAEVEEVKKPAKKRSLKDLFKKKEDEKVVREKVDEFKAAVVITDDMVFIPEVKVTIPVEIRKALEPYQGKNVVFGIRPEDINYATGTLAEKYKDAIFTMKVDVAELLGNEYILHGNFAGQRTVSKVNVDPENDIHIGDKVKLVMDLSKCHFFKVDTLEEKENLPLQERNKTII